MKPRLVAVALAVVASALLAVPAAGHHPLHENEDSTTLLFSGGKRSVFMEALAEDPPLAGIGENVEIVANVPLAPGKVPGGANDDDFDVNASDIELAGDHAYVGSYTQGMAIVNIASCNDPSRPDLCKPFIEGVYPCSGGQFDIQLSPDARIAVVAHESASTEKECHPGEEGAAIIDVSDKGNPREIAFISDRKPDGSSSGVVEDGAHNTTLDWPNLYIDQYIATYDGGKSEIFSLADPSKPVLIGEIDFPPQNGQTGFHDSFPDHRPDGKVLLYGASIQKSDVVDITDPTNPQELQTFFDPQVGISHGAETNHRRDLLIVTDEYGGGTGVGACGGNPDPDIPLPGQFQNAGVGAIHFYNLNEQGLVANNGTDKAGIFNIVLHPNEPAQVAAGAGCTSHVFWQAPDQNRMTIAWYGRGTRIVDFEDPANPKQLGFFVPQGADTWSAKPHCGYIFTGDIARGMDVLRYTGEGGAAWPTTSDRAELQRATYQGAPTPAATPCRASGASGGASEGAPPESCARAARRAKTRRIGGVHLGQRRAAVRRAMGSRGTYRRFMDRWCLRGGGALRVGYPSPRQERDLSASQNRRFRGRAVLILTSGRPTSIARVRRGTSVRTLRGRVGPLRAVRVGANVWFTRRARRATQVFKVRGGRVREVGLAARRLTETRAETRRLLRGIR
jgi:hypothetical protein